MLEQLKTFNDNTLAVEVIDGFTEADEQLSQKWIQEKLDKGYEVVNILLKMDEMKISNSSVKAFMEDVLWTLRNYKSLGHLAIVAHSKIIKALVPIDNLFFERSKKGRKEQYFDVSQMEEAMQFVTSGK